MTTGKMIRELQTLKQAVLADGKVDWSETDALLKAIRPLAARHGFLFEDYERLLERCRADGKITPEESRRLAFQLDSLCRFFSNVRLKWCLAAVTVLLCALAVYVLVDRVAEAL